MQDAPLSETHRREALLRRIASSWLQLGRRAVLGLLGQPESGGACTGEGATKRREDGNRASGLCLRRDPSRGGIANPCARMGPSCPSLSSSLHRCALTSHHQRPRFHTPLSRPRAARSHARAASLSLPPRTSASSSLASTSIDGCLCVASRCLDGAPRIADDKPGACTLWPEARLRLADDRRRRRC
jgi:hypothetical protein